MNTALHGINTGGELKIVEKSNNRRTSAPSACVVSRVRFGCTSELPDRNDGVIGHYRKANQFPFGKEVPTMAPGTYTLIVSLGRPDGTPTLALPLGDGRNRRYPVGSLTVAE